MLTRDQFHTLVERLPDDELAAVMAAVEKTIDPVTRALLLALPDDEPLTDEDVAAIERSRAAYERGDFVTQEELKRRRGL